MPVVQVQRIGHEAYVRQHLYYCLGEEAEALRLVAIKNAVNIIPSEIVFVIYEVIRYAALNKAFNPAVLIAPAKLNVKIALVAHMHAVARLYFGIKRQHDPYVRAHFFKLNGQRGGNVRKAACFYEWRAFAGGKKNLFAHTSAPFLIVTGKPSYPARCLPGRTCTPLSSIT